MCTAIRFTDDKGNMYLGRNLDWNCGFGQRVVITPTGWVPNSPFGATTSIKHPVYGMGIVAENTPLYFDCANDAGLAVAGLNFPGYANYESHAINGKTNVCAWEFPLWVTLHERRRGRRRSRHHRYSRQAHQRTVPMFASALDHR